MLTVPPTVEMLADELSGNVIVSGLAPPPELMLMLEAPLPAMAAPAPNINEGLEMVSGLPPETVSVAPAPTLIDPPAA